MGARSEDFMVGVAWGHFLWASKNEVVVSIQTSPHVD
jgi:hypothetical protein